MSSVLEWKADDIIRAVNGSCLHDQSWSAEGVSIDSRTTKKGDLFIALQGPTHDAHDHVAAALAAGAVGAIVAKQPAQVPPQSPLIFVTDTFIALEKLGHAGRARTKAKIIAVTGSVGKTGSKDMLRLMLGACGDTFATEGSLNNHWGVPLSLARLPEQAQFGIFELGMNHTGEMAALTRQVKPHIALITTIEPAHMEFFASLDAVADAKAEIFDGLPADGIAVLNSDNGQFNRLHDAARARGIKKILSFGHTKSADAHIRAIKPDENGSIIDATLLGAPIQITLNVLGAHIAMNAVGTLLTALAAGGDSEACIVALGKYQPPARRGTISKIETGKGIITIIDETYNASPAAVIAAIRVLGQRPIAQGGRRILVLGDMREMGETSAAIHAGLAAVINDNNIDLVHCCGEQMRHLYNALPIVRRGVHTDDSHALCPSVTASLHAGDIITVKGSKSMHTEIIVEAIKALGKALGASAPHHQLAS